MSWVQRVIGVCRGRPGIARLALVVYIVVATGFLVDDLQTALHRPETTDYLAFAGGARVLNSGSACLYCDGAERSTQIALLGHAPPDESGFPNRFVNPPLVALALRPLGALSLDDGLRLFTEALLLCLAIAALVAAHRVGAWPRRNALTGLGVVLATFSLPGLTSLRLAQWAPLLLLAAMGSLAAGDRRRWFVAGLSLSVLLIKPQLVWLCVPLILVSGRRRLVAGFVVGAAAWAISGVAILGPQHVGDWFSAMSGVGVAAGTEGVPGLAASIWGRPGTIVATSALGVVTVLMAWRLRGLLAA